MKYLKDIDALWEEVKSSATAPVAAKTLQIGKDQISYVAKGKTIVVTKTEIHTAMLDTLKKGELWTYYGTALDDQLNRINVKIGKGMIIKQVKSFLKSLLADATVQNGLADLVSTMLVSSNRFQQWTYNYSPLNDNYAIHPIKMAVIAPKIIVLFRAVMDKVPGVIKWMFTVDEKQVIDKNVLNKRLQRPGVVEDIISAMINISYRKVMNQKAMQTFGLKDADKLGTAIVPIDKFI